MRLMLVDDHPALRLGLRMVLEREPDMVVVAQAGSAQEAVSLFNDLAPDITIMDIKLGASSGIDAAQSMRDTAPNAKILFLTGFAHDEDVYRCVRCGAMGFVLKDSPIEELLEAIRSVYRGRRHLTSLAAEKLAQRLLRSDLTEREIETLKLMVRGLSNKEIGQELSLSLGTVKFHITNILLKLGVEDRTQAVIAAIRRGHADV